MMVLVTGGTGFVGRYICADLISRGHRVRAAVRSPEAEARLPPGVEAICVGDLGPTTDWTNALRGVEGVVHSAGLAHVGRDAPKEAYERVNSWGTARLAHQASEAGIARFVFLSSVKVHGEGSSGRPVDATDALRPGDPYARSKALAEDALLSEHASAGLPVVIVRPPLVYGPGVKANFRKLMEMVNRGVPLPLGSVRNSRSLVSVWNLTDMVVTCLLCSRATGRAWLVSDGEDVSTPDLLRRLARAMNRPARVFPFPLQLLGPLLAAVGMRAEFHRLTDSLIVNSAPAGQELGWSPPLSLSEGLERTIRTERLMARLP